MNKSVPTFKEIEVVFTLPRFQIPALVQTRLARRQICVDDLSFAYFYGARQRDRNAVRYVVRKKDIVQIADHDLAARIVGLTIVLTTDEQTLITAYKRRVKKRYSHRRDTETLYRSHPLFKLGVRWWRHHFPDLEFVPVKHRSQHRH